MSTMMTLVARRAVARQERKAAASISPRSHKPSGPSSYSVRKYWLSGWYTGVVVWLSSFVLGAG